MQVAVASDPSGRKKFTAPKAKPACNRVLLDFFAWEIRPWESLMSVSDLTKGCKSATGYALMLSQAALIQVELALDEHVSKLQQREAADPGQWTDELQAARQALRILRRA
jgi:hypothetical protein